MCHKEWKMGTIVERIQPVSPANFLYNMFKIFANTGNALTPNRLQTPFGARHESTAFCGWVSSTEKGPVHIPNQKRAMQKGGLGHHIKSGQKDARHAPGALALPLNAHLCSLDWVEIACMSLFPQHPVPSFRG